VRAAVISSCVRATNVHHIRIVSGEGMPGMHLQISAEQ
jgi:hypothetical protein